MPTKEYLEREYKLALSDYRLARTEDDKWAARKAMAKLEQLAAECYGFGYADWIRKELLNGTKED